MRLVGLTFEDSVCVAISVKKDLLVGVKKSLTDRV